jgi:hypothetical protein
MDLLQTEGHSVVVPRRGWRVELVLVLVLSMWRIRTPRRKSSAWRYFLGRWPQLVLS